MTEETKSQYPELHAKAHWDDTVNSVVSQYFKYILYRHEIQLSKENLHEHHCDTREDQDLNTECRKY